METVGEALFGIKHYWGRFEFASMRGQIHLHLLAILVDKNINNTFYDLREDKKAQAKFLELWSRSTFGYSAEVDQREYEKVSPDANDNPCQQYFCDICQDDYVKDQSRLWKFTQNHECSGYCLCYSKGRKVKAGKNAHRYVVK